MAKESIVMTVDGNANLGSYEVICAGCLRWTGNAPKLSAGGFSPALPIAECAVHLKEAHPGGTMYVYFGRAFHFWLYSYWSRLASPPAKEQQAAGSAEHTLTLGVADG